MKEIKCRGRIWSRMCAKEVFTIWVAIFFAVVVSEY